VKTETPIENTGSAPISEAADRRYKPQDVIAGKYQLIRILGEGGMGEVWEARNTALDLLVAIKLIRADLKEESAAERLWQEARAAARLGHPAIVRVFDVGETRFSDPFIVMEKLTGDNLGELLAREGRLPAVSAVQILLPIADALASAHLKGIVHRDIKPENIYLAEEENGELQPKLVDFGVAKLENAEVNSKLTQRGTIVGSPGYLAPEQARGIETADYRVDVWAFSVVLYELVTGEAPFNGGNYNALLRSIVEDEPKSTVDHAAGDAELWNILERGLRKDPAERWPSMQEYGRALAYWAFAQGVDEDICGTGLEAKWLVTRSGRASLASVNFEDSESPSAIRQRRRVRSDAPHGRNNSPGTQVPTELPPAPAAPPGAVHLPSPVQQIAAESSGSVRAFAATEFDARRAPSRRRKAVWVVGATLLAALSLALYASFGANRAGLEEQAASGQQQPSDRSNEVARANQAAQPDKAAELPNVAPIESVSDAASSAPVPSASPRTDVAAPATAAPKTRPAARAPAPSPKARRVAKAAERPIVPEDNPEKTLTKTPEAPKLDLKKPY